MRQPSELPVMWDSIPDIAHCRWALYRGTTAIVQAVVAGLRTIYLQLPGELTIDPLYEFTNWRIKVMTISEFQGVVNAEKNINICVLKSEAKAAIKYCEDFFIPFVYKILLDSLGN